MRVKSINSRTLEIHSQAGVIELITLFFKSFVITSFLHGMGKSAKKFQQYVWRIIRNEYDQA